MKFKVSEILSVSALALTCFSPQSYALPTLTAQGTALGFTIDTVVSGLPGSSSSYDVLGSAVNSAGQIVLNNSSNGLNYVFNNTNNQTAANAISTASYGGFPAAIVNANGSLWASGGALSRLNNDGSTAQTFSGFSNLYGMWTNSVNQHIIAGGGNGLYDIDVSNINSPVARLINNSFTDGVTVSLDGQIVYTNSGAYRIDTGALVASYSVFGADGMGIISSTNSLNGGIIVSTTNGNLILMDPLAGFAQTVIASGGGYGDFANTDPTTGTLLFSSANSLGRLGCGAACGIGSVVPVTPPTNGVPEPTTLAIMGLGFVGLGFNRRKRNA